jgi:hypothetical protein
MSYITLEYYRTEYLGEEVDDDKILQKYINRATDTIDQLTKSRILKQGLDKFPPLVQSQVKKAVASQVEYFAINETVNVGIEGDVASASIGSFNYSDSNSGLSRNEKMMSPSVVKHLMPTGLLYAGVDVCG